jgi:hypothetical protein
MGISILAPLLRTQSFSELAANDQWSVSAERRGSIFMARRRRRPAGREQMFLLEMAAENAKS